MNKKTLLVPLLAALLIFAGCSSPSNGTPTDEGDIGGPTDPGVDAPTPTEDSGIGGATPTEDGGMGEETETDDGVGEETPTEEDGVGDETPTDESAVGNETDTDGGMDDGTDTDGV